jgi:DNA-binding HxlR family transcriptional regulator
MNGMNFSLNRGCLYALILLIAISSAVCQEDRNISNNTDLLVLNIYIDNTGRSLINGYVDDIGKLAFLNSSEYRYEENSKQLYAVTSALTSKSNDNWSLRFEAKGGYDEYHTIFYLPADTRLKQIECSQGLEYFFYAANESIIADVQGYDVISPSTEIEYRLPFTDMPASEVEGSYPYSIIILLSLLVIGVLIILGLRFRFAKPSQDREKKNEHPASIILSDFKSNQSISDVKTDNRFTEDSTSTPKAPMDSWHGEGCIELTDEIAAVMTTLTDREQSVLKALLKHGGKMTQAEIKHETGISKSSLSGILTSLERRKVITKNELGRTNIIELSDRFLSR